MTVSRVINEQSGVGKSTRWRVQETIKHLGYRPNGIARGLKASRSGTIGLLVPDIANPYFPEVVRGAEDVALKEGYNVFLNNTLEDAKREAVTLQLLEEKRVDGIIVFSPRLPSKKLFTLLKHHRAAVVVNHDAPTDLAGVVKTDDEAGIRLAVDHLLSAGRSHLGLLAGPSTSQASRERIRAFKKVLKYRGFEPKQNLIVPCAPYVEDGHSTARTLLSIRPRIDGLICFNDLVALGTLQACAELGLRVPDDVAVVGFDDIPFARFFTPSLTTLHVPKFDLGVNAMRLLIDRMEGRNKQMAIILRPELVVRASTP